MKIIDFTFCKKGIRFKTVHIPKYPGVFFCQNMLTSLKIPQVLFKVLKSLILVFTFFCFQKSYTSCHGKCGASAKLLQQISNSKQEVVIMKNHTKTKCNGYGLQDNFSPEILRKIVEDYIMLRQCA